MTLTDGTPYTHRRLFLICDNGYHKWRSLQNPSKVSVSEDDHNWSRMIESLRKDIECTFGSLKGRFRILKYGLLFHSEEICHNTFYTCSILHNMLLLEMGLEKWDDDEYQGDAGNFDDDVLQRIFARDPGAAARGGDYSATSGEILRDPDLQRRMPMAAAAALRGLDDSDDIPDFSYLTLRKALQTHFAYACLQKAVIWPQRIRKNIEVR